jgi:hypothetical protein
MTLNDLLRKAFAAYPSSCLLDEIWDFERQRLIYDAFQVGDTLAVFIAQELKETYDPELDSDRQLQEAAKYLSVAVAELNQVVESLK